MSILPAMQSAALKLMGQRPAVFFGSSQRFEQEITDLVNDVAEDILKAADWQALTRVHTLTGDGAETEFTLPDDYDRMLLVADVQDVNSWLWGYYPFFDINAFLFAEARGFQPWPGGWIIYADRMRFVPAPATGDTATFPYLSKNYARDSATLEGKPAFTQDTDDFLLPNHLLTLGLVYRWRENKKLDSTGDQEAFDEALGQYTAKDKGSQVYRRGSRFRFPGTYQAWPWALGPA